MAILQIKNIDDEFYKKIKMLSDRENRSISQQVLFLLKDYVSKYESIQRSKTPAQILLDLSGSWDDATAADQIIAKIKKQRINSTKLSEGF
jgi:plasmid stability protein